MQTGLSVSEAQQVVLDAAPVLGSETVAVREALGRVLAESVLSGRRLPPDDCSAMDGYAVQRSDLLGASVNKPSRLEVVFEIAAGSHAPRRLAAGEAARIFTGAPLPEGADTVVRQEDTQRDSSRVLIEVEPPQGEYIRRAGEDVEVGDSVLREGVVIRAPQAGVLSSLGRSVVAVHQRPKVAILSGGDELVEPDGDITGGRIVSSNSYALSALCLEVGAEPVYLGIARDQPDDIARHLRAGLQADCIVSSAGVSVGDRDYMREVLEELGCRLDFWGVHMKPGYPLVFGRFPERGQPLVFGLPGNPVSAMVTFEQFVRPVLRKMSGHQAWFRTRVRARLCHELEKKAGRMHFVRVQLAYEGESLVASSTGNQSSGVLSSMSEAHGLLLFPAEATKLAAGDLVEVQVLDEDFLAHMKFAV